MADDKDTYRANYLKANETLRDAESAFRDALASLNDAVDHIIRTELRLIETPQEAAQYLAKMASANGSAWSGGPHSAINIIESLKRQRAVDTLARITR